VPNPSISITVAFLALILTSCVTETKTSMRAASSQPDYIRGRYVYNAFCADCHDSGEGGAPTLDDTEAWESRSLGLPSLLTDHATEGFLNMPEKGARADLSDDAVRDAVHYMIREIARGE
jgi:cytochrome c5